MAKNKEQKLKRLRREIDLADREILKALAVRFKAVKSVGKLKESMNLPVVQKARWSVVMKSRLQEAKKRKLSKKFVEAIYKIVHKEAISLQTKSRKKKIKELSEV